jgi:hypothetical protein
MRALLQALAAAAQDLELVILGRSAPGDDLRERASAAQTDIVVVQTAIADAG